MNARTLFLGLLAVASPIAVLSVGCSSSSTTVTSGGASFQFSGNGPCPDPNVTILIAAPGEDGAPKLIPDGADGAHISCKVDGNHFSIAAGNSQGTIAASGQFVNGQASNVTMTFQVGTNVYTAKPTDAAGNANCTFDILDNDGNKFRASFSCGDAESNTLVGQTCQVVSSSFFSFVDCTGF